MSAAGPSTFTIYPAIDLRGGRVVRLRQGDFAREQVYGEDPGLVAAAFADQGAGWIHVVDLDGARAGERRQGSIIEGIVRSLAERPPGSTVRLQVAGGIRTPDALAEVLAAGASRAVLGTIALRDPEAVGAAVVRHGPDRIAVALDVRDGLAIGEGWLPGVAGVPVADAFARLTAEGVTTFNVTAIDRDGLLGGPDVDLVAACVRSTDAAIVASGGIASLDDLRAVRAVGCRGAILGRSLYEGTIELAEAIAAVSG